MDYFEIIAFNTSYKNPKGHVTSNGSEVAPNAILQIVSFLDFIDDRKTVADTMGPFEKPVGYGAMAIGSKSLQGIGAVKTQDRHS